MKKLLKLAGYGSVSMVRVVYFALAVVVILVASYLLGGYDFLGGRGWGSDLTSALSMAAWVDKYFPHVPFWYPLAGGGVSITHSYPTFSFFLVSLLKRLTDLDLIQAFRVLGASGVVSLAFGIYAWACSLSEEKTALARQTNRERAIFSGRKSGDIPQPIRISFESGR